MTEFRLYNKDLNGFFKEHQTSVFDALFLDPPYFMGEKPFINKEKKYSRVVEEWDNKWENVIDYAGWTYEWVEKAYESLKPGGSILTFMSHHNLSTLLEIMDNFFTRRNIISWFLNNAPPYLHAKRIGLYADKIQYILYYTKGPTAFFDYNLAKTLNGGVQQHNLLKFNNRPFDPKLKHPTRKPLDLMEYLIKIHSPEEGIIGDCFGGSGTTLIAAKHTNRSCYIGEPNVEYFEEMLARYNND